MEIPENAILIGIGALNWDGSERRTDRYGTITLCDTNSEDEVISRDSYLNQEIIAKYSNYKGKLVAKILQARQSTHIGDLFRGFLPSTPTAGDIIEIGEGILFAHEYSWAKAVGLKPKDGRMHDWLNPESLYKCHEQTIELYFVPNA